MHAARSMRGALCAAWIWAAVPVAMVAQSGATAAAPDPCTVSERASFDVTSVKPMEGNSGSSSWNGTPDGVILKGSLRRMILNAFQLHDFQVSGGPDWVATSTWEVHAKNDTPDPDYRKLSPSELQALRNRRMQQMQALLMDRFQLKCHAVAKQLPVYELVIAKGGLKLKETTAPENKRNSDSSDSRGSQMHMTATGVTAERIAATLGNQVDRMVIDKTALTGSYDLTLDWVHDSSSASADAPSGPTIFTALEEQLGLKLQPAKGPVAVLVIDAVEKPSEN